MPTQDGLTGNHLAVGAVHGAHLPVRGHGVSSGGVVSLGGRPAGQPAGTRVPARLNDEGWRAGRGGGRGPGPATVEDVVIGRGHGNVVHGGLLSSGKPQRDNHRLPHLSDTLFHFRSLYCQALELLCQKTVFQEKKCDIA